MPLVLSEASLSQGLTQSKTLDCERGRHEVTTRGSQLTDQVGCLAAELVLLPKQNFKSLNSRRRLVPSEVRKYQSEILLQKSFYLY